MIRTLCYYFLLLALSIAFYSCGKKNIRRDYFTIDKVISGNKILLLNGYSATLIGIRENSQSKEYLQKTLSIENKVRFIFDSKGPFKRINARNKDKSFYAYVITKNNQCLNSQILINNFSEIDYHPYLNDSLTIYEHYSSSSQNEDEGRSNDSQENDHNENLYNDEENFNNNNSLSSGIQGELEKLIIACDYINPITRDFAAKQAGKSSGEFNINQVINIYDAIRPPNWHYVNDPKGINYVSKASNTISRTNLSGDCDDFAVLIYSLIMSIGGEARIVYAWDERTGHAFTEINISNFNFNEITRIIKSKFFDYEITKIHARRDNMGLWLNLDWWAAYPGGPYFNFEQSVNFYPEYKKYEIN